MLERSRQFLVAKGAEEGRLDAELLVAEALGLDRLGLFLQLDRPVTPAEVDRARELIVRRAKGEPVAYLTGRREFYGRDFAVGPGCLVPRPETELIVDAAREWASHREVPPRVLDVGTGSGCLAVTLALELARDGASPTVTAIDVEAEALAWATRNAASHDVEVAFHQVDAGAFLEAAGPDAFDLVVSNPPYVERGDPRLAPDVQAHEPAVALFAPEGDPDHWVRRLVERTPRVVAEGGLLLVELGEGQASRALALADRAGLRAVVHEDLAGISRVLEAGR